MIYLKTRKGGACMEYKNVTVRMEEKLKNDFEEVCADMGMNMTAAFVVFAKTVVRQRRIPFEVEAPAKRKDDGHEL